eukprot:3740632-Pleurochrysis_carterae.AAC.1
MRPQARMPKKIVKTTNTKFSLASDEKTQTRAPRLTRLAMRRVPDIDKSSGTCSAFCTFNSELRHFPFGMSLKGRLSQFWVLRQEH